MTTCYLFGGYPASGKSTALNEAYRQGLYTVEMGDVVRDEFESRNSEELTDNELGEWATRQKNAYGPGIMAEYAIDRISMADFDGDVAISGVRCGAEVERFSLYPEFDEVVTVGIRAGRQKRLERIQDRDGVSPSYLDERDRREREWGLEKYLNRHTDVIIRNSTVTEERFRTNIKQIIEVERHP